MVLIVDNYDSFTYNLYHYFLVLGQKTIVRCRDDISTEYVEKLNPAYIVLSPGPGRPEDAGLPLEIIDRFKGRVPILGVCLGHQCIGYYFGAAIINGSSPVHGKVHSIEHTNTGVFKELKNPFKVTRYHSLVISAGNFPHDLEITARTQDDSGNGSEIMGIKHRKFNIEGVQFHPEAVLTEQGYKLLSNFLRSRKENESDKI